METRLLIELATIPALGILAQWIAWRIRQPSIILLLLFGLAVGPLATLAVGQPFLDVEHLLGELLFPIVSIAVAVILFEGGLSLRFAEIRGSAMVVRNLVTIGTIVTWLLTSAAAYWLLNLSLSISLLLGATLVVTGPTVIIPMIKQIRPSGRVGSIVRWEGIIIDPIGAILAVLIFEEIIGGPNMRGFLFAIFETLLIGLSIGWLAGQGLVEIFRRYWVPDSLQNPITLGVVLIAFTVSNVLRAETGLATVTIMGIVMANQNRFDVRHVREFKETLQVLLVSALFILLAARIQPEDLRQIGLAALVFVALLIVAIRPLATYFSTIGSGLNWRERLFIAWMAPRGIVAASVASIFALELQERGVAGSEQIVPITFAVILGTVTFYSLTAGTVARWLGLSERDPQGLLIIGINPWSYALAKEVTRHGFRVLLADTNLDRVEQAREENLEVYYGNILSELAQEELDLSGIGRVLAVTPNAEVNALVGEQMKTLFGSDSVYQLQRMDMEDEARGRLARKIGGRFLFPEGLTYSELSRYIHEGARIATVTVTSASEVNDNVPERIMPLFVLGSSKRLQVLTQDEIPQLTKGQKVIALLKPGEEVVLNKMGAIETQAKPEQAAS